MASSTIEANQDRLEYFDSVVSTLQPVREQILRHNCYQKLETLAHLRTFMEFHVYAVWDFMSLLKALQQRLTGSQVPWVPQQNAEACRLINEIVLGEESDETPQGTFVSHYEMYLAAMEQVGANTQPIRQLIERLREGLPVGEAIQDRSVPPAAATFMRHTFALVQSGGTHEIAAAFTLGREDLIPDMFRCIVEELGEKFPTRLELFTYYLDRHIELDEDHHGPLAQQMLKTLCGTDERKWREASDAAKTALLARRDLWDAIESHLTA